MKNFINLFIFIFYIIFYVVFCIFFNTENVFWYFLHVLLLFIPIYIIFKAIKIKNNVLLWSTVWVIFLFWIYVLQYNYLNIPDSPDNFLENYSYQDFSEVKDCISFSCDEAEQIIYFDSLLDWNISFRAIGNVQQEFLNLDDEDAIKLDFNKEIIFKNYLAQYIYSPYYFDEIRGNNLFFQQKSFQDYKKTHAFYLYDSIVNQNDNTEFQKEITWEYRSSIVWDFLNKKYFYSRITLNNEVVEDFWKQLNFIEEELEFMK